MWGVVVLAQQGVGSFIVNKNTAQRLLITVG